MNIDKMIKEILDERILNDELTAKGWKKYNDGITKAVQVIREYQANDAQSKDGKLPIPHVANRRELYFAFMKEYNALMGESEYQILKEEVEVLLAKYSC